ncbi:hypothetical protein D921_01522 [Enterococcus faecalis F01966]|nr:hypothetical protein D921_01522 [Enterococcus faecalis F01966]
MRKTLENWSFTSNFFFFFNTIWLLFKIFYISDNEKVYYKHSVTKNSRN